MLLTHQNLLFNIYFCVVLLQVEGYGREGRALLCECKMQFSIGCSCCSRRKRKTEKSKERIREYRIFRLRDYCVLANDSVIKNATAKRLCWDYLLSFSYGVHAQMLIICCFIQYNKWLCLRECFKCLHFLTEKRNGILAKRR